TNKRDRKDTFQNSRCKCPNPFNPNLILPARKLMRRLSIRPRWGIGRSLRRGMMTLRTILLGSAALFVLAGTAQAGDDKNGCCGLRGTYIAVEAGASI